MGILGVPKGLFVVQCGHLESAKAFWMNNNDASNPPDLWYENMPHKGRMVLTNQTLYVACWGCRHSLDEIIADFVKAQS